MCVSESQALPSVVSFNLQPAQSLEKEVREVKATLQAMLVQLKEGEEEDVEEEEEDVEEEKRHRTAVNDCDLMENGIEEEEKEEEEEEDQYFSDSWDI